MNARFRPTVVAATVVATLAAPSARAALIRASAGLGTNVFPAVEVGFDPVFSGACQIGFRFTLGNVAHVEQVGGRFSHGSGTLYAAIVSLSSPSALPSGDPFDMTTLATTVFSPPVGSSSVDFRIPLSITLNPGSYALVFGSEHYGAHGIAFMPLLNPEIADRRSFITHGFGDSPWRLPVLDGPPRFVLEGEQIPEPSMAWLAAAAIGFLGGPARFQLRMVSREG